jgi:hypothetical protein
MATTNDKKNIPVLSDPDSSSDVEIEDVETMAKHYPVPNGNKIVQYERLDAVALRYIINHMAELGITKLVSTEALLGHQVPLDGQRTILEKYAKRVKGGKIKVTYAQQTRSRQGRYFAKGGLSLQNISRQVRHTIAKEHYHDVDIKNAHPVLLAHYCFLNGLEHECLKQYIDRRDEYFTLLLKERNMERDAAKKLMLTIINGGVIGSLGSYPPDIGNFYRELDTIRKTVMSLNPALVKVGKKNLEKNNKSQDNLSGTVVNLLMCDLENRVLVEMYNYFHTAGIAQGQEVLCFDGLMLRSDKVTEEDLEQTHLPACVDYVQEQTGICIALALKPMDEGVELPDLADDSYDAVKMAWEEHIFKATTPVEFYDTENGRIHCRNKAKLLEGLMSISYS